MYVAVAAFGFTQGVFFTSYLINTRHFSPSVAAFANLIAAVGYLLATLAGGLLSDRMGRTKAYIVGGFLIIGATVLMFVLGAAASQPVLLVGMVVVGAMSGIAYGAQASLFFELFPARVRYTGVSLGFQIAAVLGGGLTPLVAASLTQATGGTTAIAALISVLAILMIVCTLAAPRVLAAEQRVAPAGVTGD
jgi:MHS family shikimate/dehydroshikimate transporter-like MFS transporter